MDRYNEFFNAEATLKALVACQKVEKNNKDKMRIGKMDEQPIEEKGRDPPIKASMSE